MWFFKKNIDVSHIEEALIEADFGPLLSESISMELKKNSKTTLKKVIEDIVSPYVDKIPLSFTKKLNTIMLIGVNGSGKTTTVAKLAKLFIKNSLNVSVAACDTFRVAATEQLVSILDPLKTHVFKTEIISKKYIDPASVAYNAISNTKEGILLIDTAGRLTNNTNLMNELTKISNVLKKVEKDAPDYVYITIDATTGQNSIEQAIEFNNTCKISGVILNKMDGGAKGGTIVRIINELKIPIVAIGNGEKIDDIDTFDIDKFVETIE